MHWTLPDGLTTYREVLRDEARTDYRHAQLLYLLQAPYSKSAKPPTIPPILLR